MSDPRMLWTDAYRAIAEYCVRINVPPSCLNPSGYGTGFKIGETKGKGCVIATAMHVVKDIRDHKLDVNLHTVITSETADEPPMRLGKPISLPHSALGIAGSNELDLAILVVPSSALSLPTMPVACCGEFDRLREGSQIGWCGFANIATDQLCFFSGWVSASLKIKEPGYYVDGTSIPGCSGGPAFIPGDNPDRPFVIAGVVSAYMPVNSTYEKLIPGLTLVTGFQPMVSWSKEYITLQTPE